MFNMFSDCWKEVHLSRPSEEVCEWFEYLTEGQQGSEIERLLLILSETQEMEEAQFRHDLKSYRQYGDFTEAQLEQWGVL
jgi:hypothetical protein